MTRILTDSRLIGNADSIHIVQMMNVENNVFGLVSCVPWVASHRRSTATAAAAIIVIANQINRSRIGDGSRCWRHICEQSE